MATAIYHGFLIHGLATMLSDSNSTKAKLTPSTFVLTFTILFDMVCVAALASVIF